MRRRLAFLAVLFFALGTIGCEEEIDQCAEGFSLICPKPIDRKAMLQAKQHISNFDGARARDIYLQANDEYKKYHKGQDMCEATYGVVLADSQIIVSELNGLVLRFLVGGLAPAPGFSSAAAGQLKPRYKTAAGAHDFGIELENLWASIEPTMIEMAAYAGAVTTIANCSYSIGVGDGEPKTPTGQENPYKYVLNIGDSKLPVIQLAFQGRFDGAEARALETLMRTSMAVMNLILVHDLSLTIDVAKLAYLIGVPVECLKDDILGCGAKVLSGEITAQPANLLDAAFIFEENPKFLAKSEKDPNVPQADRWARRMPWVYRDLARGFYTLRSFFQALVARSVALQGTVANEKIFNEYVIVFRDSNENGKIDGQDDFGLNIKKIDFDCQFFIAKFGLSETQAEKCNTEFDTLDELAAQAITFLPNLFAPTEAAVGEFQTFFERMYGNTGGVENPALTAERIPINSFNAVTREFFSGISILNADTPNFMELDLKAFFNNAKPVRDFVPYWSKVTDSFTLTRFLADSDWYAAYDPVTGGTHWLTSPQYAFDPRYKNMVPDWLDPIERDLFTGVYDGGINGTLSSLRMGADCLNGKNLFMVLTLNNKTTKLSAPVFAFPLPDPTLNTMIYLNLDEWKALYDNNGNGADRFTTNPFGYPSYDCRSDPSGFVLADNRTLTKSMWLYLDFWVDHFILASFAQTILDTLGIEN